MPGLFKPEAWRTLAGGNTAGKCRRLEPHPSGVPESLLFLHPSGVDSVSLRDPAVLPPAKIQQSLRDSSEPETIPGECPEIETTDFIKRSGVAFAEDLTGKPQPLLDHAAQVGFGHRAAVAAEA